MKNCDSLSFEICEGSQFFNPFDSSEVELVAKRKIWYNPLALICSVNIEEFKTLAYET